ncbi:hypothetical protein ACNKHO_24910 [Shigella flexneri]
MSLLTGASRTEQRAGHILAPFGGFQVLNDSQRRAAHFGLQLGNREMQQRVPVLVARQA